MGWLNLNNIVKKLKENTLVFSVTLQAARCLHLQYLCFSCIYCSPIRFMSGDLQASIISLFFYTLELERLQLLCSGMEPWTLASVAVC